jgi:hypothetical protein
VLAGVNQDMMNRQALQARLGSGAGLRDSAIAVANRSNNRSRFHEVRARSNDAHDFHAIFFGPSEGCEP